MSALFFVLAGQFPVLLADPGGLSLFPRAVAVLTGLASAIFLIQSLRSRTASFTFLSSASRQSVERWLVTHHTAIASFVLVGLLPFAIQWLGFVAAIGLFTVLMLGVSRVRLVPLAMTAVLTTAGIYLAYAIVLGAILPAGKLWE